MKTARAIYNLVGMTDAAKIMECKIKTASSMFKDLPSTVQSNLLQISKNDYENNLNKNGKDSISTLYSGLGYVRILRREACVIEALRLVTKLADISRRVLGPEYKMTKEADELLSNYEVREVILLPDVKHFQALRYENDGEICVVQGQAAQ
jgi:hypothetical protein